MCLPAQLLITIGVSLWLGLQYDPYTAFAGAGIPVFSFITPAVQPAVLCRARGWDLGAHRGRGSLSA